MSPTLIAAGGSSPSISDDGRYVAYVASGNAFLYDRLAGTSTLISHDASSSKGTLLALTAVTGSVTAGQAFALTATVIDPFGNTDTTFNGMVTLALAAGSPAGATLGGTSTATAVNGVAHFNNVLLTQAGTGYALTASAAGITPALTAAFAVLPAAANQLGFLKPPSLSLIKQPLPSTVVAVEDAYGNVVSSAASVTVSLTNNTTGATLGGTATVAAVNGLAAFTTLTVNLAGSYTLTANATGFGSAASASFAVTATAASIVITTVAGTGGAGFSGDGGPATAGQLSRPFGVAVDAQGNLYIADNDNSRVRKVSAAGIITTIAGAGTNGPGDTLSNPRAVAVDGQGNVYIADSYNNRVLKLTPGGVLTTFAGSPSDSSEDGDGGLAVNAGVYSPQAGLAVDALGNVYIGEPGTVRKVAANGIITTVAGNPNHSGFSGDGGPATAAGLSYVYGVAVDAAGNLYIADFSNNRVREVTAANGIISTIAGTGTAGFGGDGGPASAALLNSPFGVAVDASGNLYIGDYGNNSIRKVSPGGIITTVAGNGSGPVGSFGGDGGPALHALLYGPSGLATDAAGRRLRR